jgi:glycolate oxidase
VTPAVIDELRDAVGEPHVVADDPDAMQDYAHDEVAGDKHVHMPEAVVRPGSAQEVSRILTIANRERIPVTPRGAGSGLSGGAVPVRGGIVLSLERMNHILEIDTDNLVAVVEPGVVTNDLNDAVKEHGLFYAGYPMSVELCFVGGNVAENAGGGRAIKYGVTGRYVLGLEVVLPTGRIVQLGGKRVKDVTGYDLIHLMVGSEGTLGVFTKITLRLLPRPTARAVLLIPFYDARTAIGAVPRLMTRGRIIPTSVEFMDKRSIEAAYTYTGERLPHPDVGAMLLIEIDGASEERVRQDMNSIVDRCLELGALDVFVGNTPRDERRMWRPRQEMAEALKAICPVQSMEDIVVPMAQIPDLMPQLERLARRFDVLVPCYGHAGDGNLHATVVKKPEMSMTEWEEKLPALLTELYTAVAALGGTISGEHGIGSKRAHYLPLVMDQELVELQRSIKKVFDPLNILNPGKIFPPEQPSLFEPDG